MESESGYAVLGCSPRHPRLTGSHEGMPREAIEGLEPFIWPFLFALSLLHCKNTTLRQVDPPEKLVRAAAKRGRPLHRYHVLEVEPMREILERDGHASQSGLKHALHICRGHFKDYRERGLFGRNHGVYWWPQYARGDVERGTVAKDYAVRAS